jgi:hypothetical protein
MLSTPHNRSRVCIRWYAEGSMKSKYVRAVVIFVLGALVASIGSNLGGPVGDFVTILGGVAAVCGIVTAFTKEKVQP